MEVYKISNDLRESLGRYFYSLANLGYVPYERVDELLIFAHIEDILTGPMSLFVSERDYNSMVKSMYCMYGKCLTPYPDYKKSYDLINKTSPDKYRATEDKTLRRSVKIRTKL